MNKIIDKNTLVTKNADKEMIRANFTNNNHGSLVKRLVKAFISPITLLFAALAILLVCMGKTELWSFMLISMIVLVYGILRFE